MLQLLNGFFFVFHTLWIAFVAAGWAWRRSRPYHLAAVAVTALSWFVVGYWRGWGYCFCTDWHAQVRARLGYPPLGGGYTRFLIRHLTGITLNDWAADALVGSVFFAAAGLSIALWLRDRSSRRGPARGR